MIPTVNEQSLDAELQSAKEQVEVLRKTGKVSPEADAVFGMLMRLLTLLLAVLLEKTTRKTSRNSSIQPSQLDAAARRANPGRKPNPANDLNGPTLQKVTTEESLTVAACGSCGADLSEVTPLKL